MSAAEKASAGGSSNSEMRAAMCASSSTTRAPRSRAAATARSATARGRWFLEGEINVSTTMAGLGSRANAAMLFSGCQDWEFSYDASFDGRPNGAFTYAALQALGALPAAATYRDWFRKIREMLPTQNYPQTPNAQGTSSMKAWRVLEEGR